MVSAETALLHEFDKPKVYEGCMPIEVLAGRGADAIRFGPMKPVGLRDPRTGHRPWAVLQLRAENAGGDALEPRRVPDQPEIRGAKAGFRPHSGSAPGRIRPVRSHAPQHLPGFPPPAGCGLPAEDGAPVFFAGQMTGVEGYMESAASGIVAGLSAVRMLQGREPFVFPGTR